MSTQIERDELLRKVAELLTTGVRKRDTLASLGEREFGILLEHCEVTQANRVAESIRESVADPVNRALLRSINDVGHALRKQTIAHAVESQETLELARELGVDFAQGFIFGRPSPVP